MSMYTIKAMIPSAVTLSNTATGFIAIILCFVALKTGNKKIFDYAFYAIILCIFLDIADGFLARKLNAKSKIGAKLDSKCDAVSFGVAPAVFLAFAGVTLFDGYIMVLSIIIALGYLCSALFRFAQFDITKAEDDERGHLYFSGFPSPGAALICSAASLAVVNLDMNIFCCLVIYLANAYLMVSKIKYPDLPKHYFYRKRSFLELVPFVFLLVFMPIAYATILFIAIYESAPIVRKIFYGAKREL